MNLSKGFKNIFSPTLINLLIVLTLVIILILVYLKNKNIDLFDTNTDYLQSIINNIKTNQAQKQQFASRLATQEQTILNLQKNVSNILSPI